MEASSSGIQPGKCNIAVKGFMIEEKDIATRLRSLCSILQLNSHANQMATQETVPAPAPAPAPPAPSAEVVGNAFVEQYYHILHKSPRLVHRFYQDSSLLSRPEAGGVMETVTTTQDRCSKKMIGSAEEKDGLYYFSGKSTHTESKSPHKISLSAINDKIISLNYEDYTAEIKTADAQDSYGKGVIVLVTGCLIGKDNVRKKFSQSFFLAPQDRGYFVLNDVFRFIEETEPLQNNSAVVNGIHNPAPSSSWTLEQEPSQSSDHAIVDQPPSFEEEDPNNGAEVCDPSDKEEGSVTEEVVIENPIDSTQNIVGSSVDAVPAASEDASKKSYASIVKVMKGNRPSNPVYVPTNNVRPLPANPEQQLLNSTKATSETEALAPASGNATESGDIPEEAEGYSIYVRNLPYNATTAQLDETFKKFGPIKHDGIQVRSSKQGYCFGFVEFASLSSMHSALEASPISFGDHPVVVEVKRTNTRVSGSGRGRYASGRSGFWSDSFKSRRSSGIGRGYGRNEFRNQAELSGRTRGSAGRGGEDYQRAGQDGNKRGGRNGGAKGSSVPP
ncbi:hypothetical protein K2173_028339 [Erythroxylum novogranatense]|uniref:Uncharacterized protein n=1 Tax=Erythroxylum novogranatense TaxID=1862640 RepID=A0AAV8U1J3_9ROSI|nr:hypothetical protein K2173_028339 [Erythroxylum novogranatense]